MAFIQVVASENSREILEMPLEDDNSLDAATLVSQFPGAIGLRYKADSGAWRAVKASGTYFIHPGGEWSLDAKYVVTYSTSNNNSGNSSNHDNASKRKGEDEVDREMERAKRLKQTSELIVLSIPSDVTEEGMRSHFETFGPLASLQMKKRPDGTSRGFGFVRYQELEDQKNCLADPHVMGDRKMIVKLSKGMYDDVTHNPIEATRGCRRIHVGNVTSNISSKDLSAHFSKYGPITNIFVPKETPNRLTPMYAFLTFKHEDDARALMESTEPHTINGDTVSVAYSTTDVKPNNAGQKKSLLAAFEDHMQQFVDQVFAGQFGNDKPRSRAEASQVMTGLVKKWIEYQGGFSGAAYGGHDVAVGRGFAPGYQGGYSSGTRASGTYGGSGSWNYSSSGQSRGFDADQQWY